MGFKTCFFGTTRHFLGTFHHANRYLPSRHVTGTIRPITTKAYYVKELKQDLLGGSALTSERYRVILDKDNDIAGIYPVLQIVSPLLVNTREA